MCSSLQWLSSVMCCCGSWCWARHWAGPDSCRSAEDGPRPRVSTLRLTWIDRARRDQWRAAEGVALGRCGAQQWIRRVWLASPYLGGGGIQRAAVRALAGRTSTSALISWIRHPIPSSPSQSIPVHPSLPIPVRPRQPSQALTHNHLLACPRACCHPFPHSGCNTGHATRSWEEAPAHRGALFGRPWHA